MAGPLIRSETSPLGSVQAPRVPCTTTSQTRAPGPVSSKRTRLPSGKWACLTAPQPERSTPHPTATGAAWGSASKTSGWPSAKRRSVRWTSKSKTRTSASPRSVVGPMGPIASDLQPSASNDRSRLSWVSEATSISRNTSSMGQSRRAKTPAAVAASIPPWGLIQLLGGSGCGRPWKYASIPPQWAARSRTSQSEHGVGLDQSSGLSPASSLRIPAQHSSNPCTSSTLGPPSCVEESTMAALSFIQPRRPRISCRALYAVRPRGMGRERVAALAASSRSGHCLPSLGIRDDRCSICLDAGHGTVTCGTLRGALSGTQRR